MTDRQKCMEAVYTNGFALDEARLFLNTHPKDAAALAYYNKTAALYEQAVAAYEERFGPIRPEHGGMNGSWSWAQTPWPWEGGR